MKIPKEVLDKVDEAVLKEEMALPVYSSHISSALFWSGLPEEKQKFIIESLEILERESLGHVQAFKRVKEILLNE